MCEGDSNEVSVVRDPSRSAHAVVEQRSGISMIEPHFGAFLVDVGAVYFVVVVGVEDRRVNFLSGGAWLNVEVVVMVDHNARQSSLGGDPHRPRAHVTLGGAGASKADKSRKVSNVSGAERRGGTKEMLGSNKVVAFNRITFVEPRRRDDIGVEINM